MFACDLLTCYCVVLMEISDDLHDAILNLGGCFEEAEERLTKVVQIGEELPIPALNELRYSGYHLLKAFKTASIDQQLEEVAKATKHSKRASYDAVEIGILYYLEKIQLFQEDYSKTQISSVLPDYIDLCIKAEASRELISDADKDDRHKYYEQAFAEMDKLKKVLLKLTIAREELNKKIENENTALRKERQRSKRWRYAFIVTVLGVLVTIIVGFKSELKEVVSPGEVQASKSIYSSGDKSNEASPKTPAKMRM